MLAIFALAAFGAATAWCGPALARSAPAQTPSTGPSRTLAKRDVQIGQYYLKIGKYDASISRFQSATSRDPSWAVPHEMLGEAYEKKNDRKRALAEYREYLKIAPHAKDARKIEQRVEKLTRDVKDQDAGSL